MADKPVGVHEDYTIEIGGEVIGGLSKQDLIKLRDLINQTLGIVDPMSIPVLPAMPQDPFGTNPPWNNQPYTWSNQPMLSNHAETRKEITITCQSNVH